LLRAAPVLDKHIEHINSQFERKASPLTSILGGEVNRIRLFFPDDQLLPKRGKDEAYDQIQDEIIEVKEELDKALVKLAKKLGFASHCFRLRRILIIFYM
jgi:hypothetical protein